MGTKLCIVIIRCMYKGVNKPQPFLPSQPFWHLPQPVLNAPLSTYGITPQPYYNIIPPSNKIVHSPVTSLGECSHEYYMVERAKKCLVGLVYSCDVCIIT